MKKRALILTLLLVGTIAAISLETWLFISLDLNTAFLAPTIIISLVPIVLYSTYPYITAGWIKRVQQRGKQAQAILLSDPQSYLQGIGSYQGGDLWLDLPVKVQPADDLPFEAKMKCRLSQSVFGLLELGSEVTVKYDPLDKSRVVLIGDPLTLLSSRKIEQS